MVSENHPIGHNTNKQIFLRERSQDRILFNSLLDSQTFPFLVIQFFTTSESDAEQNKLSIKQWASNRLHPDKQKNLSARTITRSYPLQPSTSFSNISVLGDPILQYISIGHRTKQSFNNSDDHQIICMRPPRLLQLGSQACNTYDPRSQPNTKQICQRGWRFSPICHLL